MEGPDRERGLLVKHTTAPEARPKFIAHTIRQHGATRRITFLDLPSELRNQIYEYCILDAELEIVTEAKTLIKPFGEPATLKRPEGNPAGTSFAEYWQRMLISRSPVQHRSSWIVEPMELYRKFIINRAGNPEIGATMAKQLPLQGGFHAFEASYIKSNRTRSPNVNLFLANKQICREASILFFEKNHFVFNPRWEDLHMAPMAFLWDHPSAYTWMRSLHITMPDPPTFVNHGYNPKGENAVPSNGRWKDLVTQVRKLKLRHLGLTISVDVTDRFNRGYPFFPLSAAYTYRWYRELFAINGLQSMRLLFDVNFQYTNPDIGSVTEDKPSDIPAVMALAQETKDHWLSGKGSYEDALLFVSNSLDGAGATGQRLEFISWIKAENPGEWVFPRHHLPPFLRQHNTSWYQFLDLTPLYKREDYTRRGIGHLLGMSDNEASRLFLRHPPPNFLV